MAPAKHKNTPGITGKYPHCPNGEYAFSSSRPINGHTPRKLPVTPRQSPASSLFPRKSYPSRRHLIIIIQHTQDVKGFRSIFEKNTALRPVGKKPYSIKIRLHLKLFFQKELVQLRHKGVYVFKLPINGSESDVCHLVEFFQAVHNMLSDLMG